MSTRTSQILWFLTLLLCSGRLVADPAPGFVIEAEDFDFDGGQSVPAASTMPYLGGAYAGFGAVYGIDFGDQFGTGSGDSDSGSGDAYRSGDFHYQPVVAGGEAVDRGTWEVSPVYRLSGSGWAQWHNYTRTIPAGRYRVYAAMSAWGSGNFYSELAVVVGGHGTAEQTLQSLGTFSWNATGASGVNRLVPLVSGETPLVVEFAGQTTLRHSIWGGDVDYFQFVAEEAPVILTQPSDKMGTVGEALALTVDAGGGAGLEYQWRRNGRDIPGATGATLELDPFSVEDLAGYDVLVSNDAGSTPSGLARLTAAFRIQIGDTVSDGVPAAGAGRIEGDELDTYLLTITAPTQVFVDDLAADFCWESWRLVSPTGVEVFSRWFGPCHGLPVGVVALPEVGTYRFELGIGNSTGTYSFRVLPVEPPQLFPIVVGEWVEPGLIAGAPVAGAGNLESPGSVDEYTLDLAEGQWVAFEERAADNCELRWQLLKADDTVVFDQSLSSTCGLDPSVTTIQFTEAGIYRLRVYGRGRAEGGYTFATWNAAPQTFVLTTPFGVTVGTNWVNGVETPGAGRIETPGASDVYEFQAVAGDWLYFDEFDGDGSCQLRFRWELQAPDGTQLWQDPLGFGCWWWWWGGDFGRYQFPQSGTYRLRVVGYESATGDYGFRLLESPAQGDFAIAVGDTVAEGLIGGASVPGAGKLEYPGGEDVYVLTVTDPVRIYFEDNGAENCCLTWALFAPGGEVWVSDRLDGGDPGRVDLTTPGEYRIRVRPESSVDSWLGTYSFTLRPVPADDVFAIDLDTTVTDGAINGVSAAGAGRLEEPGAYDLYTFEINAPTPVFLEELGVDACCLNWLLIQPDGNAIMNDRLDGSDPGRRELNQLGTYQIRVYPAAALPEYVGGYSFRLRTVPPDEFFDIALGELVADGDIGGRSIPGAGRLEAPGSVDYYRFTLTAPGALYFDDLGSGQCCLAWWVRDPAGTYHFFDGFDGGDPGRRDFSQAGEYQIAVYPNGASADYTGAYSFRVLEIPPDGGFAIAVGQTVTDGAIEGTPTPGAGRLELPGAVDYYRFTLEGPTAVYFDDLGAGQCCLSWWVRDPSGSYRFFDRLDGEDPGRADFTEAGEYTVAVYPNGASVDYVGPYSFRLLWVAPDEVFPLGLNQSVEPGRIGGVDVAGAGVLSTAGALDGFEFTLSGPTSVYFDDQGSDVCCLAWWVRDPAGTYHFFDLLDGGDPGFIHFPNAGTYRIGVYPNGNSPEYQGGYRFTLWNATPETFVMEDARAVSPSEVGTVATPGAGGIDVPGQTDVYTFLGVAGQRLHFRETAGNACALHWRLEDPSGNVVFSHNLGTGGCDDGGPGLRELAATGSYRIVVGAYGSNVGAYGFEILSEVVSYASSGWRYRQVAAGEALGFESGPEPEGFADGAAPFGDGSCPGPASTFWSPGTEIAIRRVVELPEGAKGLVVSAAIDNDVRVWWNGIELTTDWAQSEGCAVADRFVFSVPDERVLRGSNLLAVRGRDRGGAAYLDVAVRAVGLSADARLILGVAPTQLEGSMQTATVTREGATDEALEVTLSSVNPGRLTVPANVVIPVGEISATFAVTATDDDVVTLEPTVELVASAPGLLAAGVGVKVLENDIPALALEFPAGGLREDAPGGSGSVRLVRTPGNGPVLTVQLTGAVAGVWGLPGVLTIPAGAASVDFGLPLVNDGVADGDFEGAIGGQLLVDGQVLRVLDFGVIRVADDDIPRLGVAVAPTEAVEGVPSAAMVTVSRNTPTTEALVVTLGVTGNDEASVPPTLEIPAGATTAEAILGTLLDGVHDGDQTIAVQASAPGHGAGEASFRVVDVDLPNLVVESVSVPPVSYLGLPSTIRWRIRNAGTAPVTVGWHDRLLLSADGLVGDDTVLLDVPTTAGLPLAPGASADLELTGVLPLGSLPPGQYHAVVLTDIGGVVRESSESDNAAISGGGDLRAQLPLTVAPAGYDTPEGTTLEFTVDRGAVLPFATVVNVASSDPANLQAPLSVIIPAGESGVTFQAVAVEDDIIEEDMPLVLTLSSAGFISRTVDVLIRRSDHPTVVLSAVPAQFSEGAGAGASQLTVTRSPVSSLPLLVGLSSSNPSELWVTTMVVIPANEASVTTTLDAINDAVVDGDKQVMVHSVIVASGVGGGSVEVTILDDDVAALTLSVVDPVVGEGRNPATIATVRRNTSTVNPLTVSLSSLDTTELIVPAEVIIPAGEATVTFAVLSVDDGVTDGEQVATLRANAAGHLPGEVAVTVTDTDLPDLAVVSVSGPPTTESESQINVTYRVENRGRTTATGPIVTRLFLSADAVAGGDILVNQYSFNGDLPPGGFFEFSPAFFAPRTPGSYRWVVLTDAAETVRELSEVNNTLVGPDAVDVVPEYTVTVETPVTVAPTGTVVPFSGVATLRTGQPAASKLVSVHVLVRGTRRIIGALTASDGSYSGVFRPLPGEAGAYELAAGHPGVGEPPVQDAFVLLGFRVLAATEVRLSEGSSAMGTAVVENLSGEPLTGMAVEVVSGLPGISIVPTLEAPVLPGVGSLFLSYEVSAGPGTAGSGSARLRVSCAQGPTVEFEVPVRVDALRPSLAAQPTEIVVGVLRGEQRLVEVDLVNQGGLPTGPVSVELPPLPWLSLVTEQPLASIGIGETRRVAFRLAPGSEEALTEHAGSVFFRMTDAALNLPFRFRVLSDGRGTLRVAAVDEFTFYAPGAPKVAGARVSVRDSVSRVEVRSGVTGADGFAEFTELPEGYYEVEVGSDQHSTYRGNTLVVAGQTAELEALILRQTVRYIWTVEQIQIEDRTQITVEAVFETAVPAPVVIVEPAILDAEGLDVVGQEKQVDMRISNHGLIAAQDVALSPGTHPWYEIIPLIRDIGPLPANSSLVVPVRIVRTGGPSGAGGGRMAAPAAGVPCQLSMGLAWFYPCGRVVAGQGIAVPVLNIKGDCGTATSTPGGGWSFNPQGCLNCGGPSWVLSPTIQTKGDCDQCMAKAIIECAIGFTPAGCGYGLFQCFAAPSDPGGSSPGEVAETCVLAGIGCIPNPWINAAQCVYAIAKCKLAPGGGGGAAPGSGRRGAAPLGDGVVSSDPLTASSLDALKVIDWFVLLWGGSADEWFGEGAGDTPGGWFAAFAAALDPSSDGGGMITDAERAALLLAPRPPTVPESRALAAIERWNRTLEYWRRGWLEIADVAPGESTDFVPLSALRSQSAKVVQAFDTARSKGSENPFIEVSRQLDIRDQKLAAGDGSVCARVRLRLDQTAIQTRDAFKATLELINGSDGSLGNVQIEVFVKDESGNDASDRFGFRAPVLAGLSAADGTGTLAPQTDGSVSWVLVPTVDAAPITTTPFYISGRLRYTQDGATLDIPLTPQRIDVHPSPQLAIQYFHQRDVFSDDPFTPEIEPRIPYSLGVMVRNFGRGTARNFRIVSAQPQIVENEKGLLVDFQLIATEIAGLGIFPTLTAEFGEIPPGDIQIGRWLFTSSLQGAFTDYSATFEHLDAIAGKKTSLIDSVEIHEMTRMVETQGGLADGKPDFLVNDDPDDRYLPDHLYLSDGTVQPVSVVEGAVADGEPGPLRSEVLVRATVPAGWVYLRILEPSMGGLPLRRVVRSDGTELPLDKLFWVTDRTFGPGGTRPVYESILHVLDLNSTGEYRLMYGDAPPLDETPPESAVAGLPAVSSSASIPVSWSGSDAATGIASYDVFVSVDGGPAVVWLAGTAATSGVYVGTPGGVYGFHSVAVDGAGNREPAPAVPDAVTRVNRAPVAANDPVTAREGVRLRIPVAQMLANDSDPDADPLTVLEVDPASAAGGSVSLTGGWVLYTPPAGPLVGDTIGYVVGDPFTGTARGSLLVTFAGAEGSRRTLLNITPGAGGAVLEFVGIPGRTYRVDRSATISPPWIPLGTTVADRFGRYTITDPEALGGEAFYRTVEITNP